MKKHFKIQPSQVKIQNFYKYVMPEPMSGCWLWNGYIMPNGYGMFSIGTKSVLAHRASFVFFNKKEIGQLVVCHKCDTPQCVNPEHLFLGTQLDNIKDAIKKGRLGLGQFKKKHCKNGHEKIGDNALKKGPRIVCKICNVQDGKNYYQKNKQIINEKRKARRAKCRNQSIQTNP